MPGATATEPDPRSGDRRSEHRASADAHDAFNRARTCTDKQVEELALPAAPHMHRSRPVAPPLQQPAPPPSPPPHRKPSQRAESERRDVEPAEAASLGLARELLQFRPMPDAMDAWLDRIAEHVPNAAPMTSQQCEPARTDRKSVV